MTLRRPANGLAVLIGERNETIGYAIPAFFNVARITAYRSADLNNDFLDLLRHNAGSDIQWAYSNGR